MLVSLEISSLPVLLTEICGCRPSAVLDHGRLVLANVLFPPRFLRNARAPSCPRTSRSWPALAEIKTFGSEGLEEVNPPNIS